MVHVALFKLMVQLDFGNEDENSQTELLECDAEPKPEKPKKKQLSYRTLVLHRFLALVTMVLILAVGIILNTMSVMT